MIAAMSRLVTDSFLTPVPQPLRADLAVSDDHPRVRGQFVNTHRAARVELVRADADVSREDSQTPLFTDCLTAIRVRVGDVSRPLAAPCQRLESSQRDCSGVLWQPSGSDLPSPYA